MSRLASSPAIRFMIALMIYVGLVIASSFVGIPHDDKGREALPGIALDWPLLFHVLRASAFLVTVGTVALIAWRGGHGEWPVKFGNVEYAPKEAVAVTAEALAAQDERLRLIEEHVGLAPPPVEQPTS